MSEVELGGIETSFQIISSHHLVNGNAHERVMFRGTSVIDVVGPFRRYGNNGTEQGKERRLHLDEAANNLLNELPTRRRQ